MFKGVFPVYGLIFKIGTKGRTSTDTDMKEVEELESCGLSIDGTIDEWTNMASQGWGSALMTGKKFSMDLKGKRSIGDAGNDYIADTAWKDGLDCSSMAEITFPDGAKLEFDCVINVTNPGTGESTNVAGLEFTLQSDGKPDYTPAA